MDIQELRIGNYISDEGEFATVELINGETEEVFYKGPRTYLSDNIQYIVPIEINDNILKKLGFENIKFKYEVNYFIIWLDPRSTYYYLNYEGNSIEIKYVHQLQNLYFALTGRELTVA